jgi:hypothetical protein
MPIVTKSVKLEYPKGTRTADVKVPFDAEGGLYMQLQNALDKAFNKWHEEHGEWIELDPLREDMFITVGFTTFHMIVEVSDRMRL